MGWSIEHIEKLAKEGKIKGYQFADTGKKIKAPPVKQTKEPAGIQFIKQQLDKANIPFVTEHRFHDVRKFRFDIAIPLLKIAIEYEGLVATGQKGGHQTKKHYTKDAEKYNLATMMGWRVYRYTALNYKNFENDLKTMFQ